MHEDEDFILPTIEGKWIWDGLPSLCPPEADGMLITLDGTSSSLLNWSDQLRMCSASTLLYLNLGLFTETKLSLEDPIYLATIKLAMGHFKRCAVEMKLSIAGLLLGRVLPTPSEAYRGFEQLKTALKIAQELSELVPDSIPIYIEIDLNLLKRSESELLFYDSTLFEPLLPILKNGTYQSRYPCAAISQTPPQVPIEPAKIGIVHCADTIQMIGEYETQGSLAVATLDAFSSNWEGIEQVVVPSSLSSNEERILKGFVATGGIVHYFQGSKK